MQKYSACEDMDENSGLKAVLKNRSWSKEPTEVKLNADAGNNIPDQNKNKNMLMSFILSTNHIMSESTELLWEVGQGSVLEPSLLLLYLLLSQIIEMIHIYSACLSHISFTKCSLALTAWQTISSDCNN